MSDRFKSGAPDITWETDLPLFSRRMLGQWTLAMLVTALVMAVILGLTFAAQGEWDALAPMALLILTVTAGLWVLGLLIMAVGFRGRYRVRYTLSDRGIRCDTIDRVATTANRLAIIAGALARKPQVAGAGVIGVTRESEEARWSGAFRAVPDPENRGIALRNAWRTLLWVQCDAENYATVAAAIAEQMRLHETPRRAARRSPVPAYLGRTLLVLAASFPLFPLAEEFEAGLFVPLCILCFSLATVWLINLFGWVVIGGLIALAIQVVNDQLTLRNSWLHPGATYRGWEVLGGDELSLLLVGGIGAGALVWLSVRALRGRWLAALVQGYADLD